MVMMQTNYGAGKQSSRPISGMNTSKEAIQASAMVAAGVDQQPVQNQPSSSPLSAPPTSPSPSPSGGASARNAKASHATSPKCDSSAAENSTPTRKSCRVTAAKRKSSSLEEHYASNPSAKKRKITLACARKSSTANSGKKTPANARKTSSANSAKETPANTRKCKSSPLQDQTASEPRQKKRKTAQSTTRKEKATILSDKTKSDSITKKQKTASTEEESSSRPITPAPAPDSNVQAQKSTRSTGRKPKSGTKEYNFSVSGALNTRDGSPGEGDLSAGTNESELKSVSNENEDPEEMFPNEQKTGASTSVSRGSSNKKSAVGKANANNAVGTRSSGRLRKAPSRYSEDQYNANVQIQPSARQPTPISDSEATTLVPDDSSDGGADKQQSPPAHPIASSVVNEAVPKQEEAVTDVGEGDVAPNTGDSEPTPTGEVVGPTKGDDEPSSTEAEAQKPTHLPKSADEQAESDVKIENVDTINTPEHQDSTPVKESIENVNTPEQKATLTNNHESVAEEKTAQKHSDREIKTPNGKVGSVEQKDSPTNNGQSSNDKEAGQEESDENVNTPIEEPTDKPEGKSDGRIEASMNEVAKDSGEGAKTKPKAVTPGPEPVTDARNVAADTAEADQDANEPVKAVDTPEVPTEAAPTADTNVAALDATTKGAEGTGEAVKATDEPESRSEEAIANDASMEKQANGTSNENVDITNVTVPHDQTAPKQAMRQSAKEVIEINDSEAAACSDQPEITKVSSKNAGDGQEVARPSGRKRKTPSNYVEEQHSEAGENKKQKTMPNGEDTENGKKLKPMRGKWAPDYLLNNPRSRLSSVHLTKMLETPESWDSLSRAEQLELIAMLPNASVPPDWPETESLPNVPAAYIRKNAFQQDCRLFQEDIQAGRYDKEWQRQAAEAMERRANGEFDDIKEKEFEEFWGQKQKVDHSARAGDSSNHSLTELVAGKCFEVGDIWRIHHVMGKGNDAVVVSKEAKLIEIRLDSSLKFLIPPGKQHSFNDETTDRNVTVESVKSPKNLSDALLREDGRIPRDHRGANSWLKFRCMRRNQDMGSPWDIRELFHTRQGAK